MEAKNVLFRTESEIDQLVKDVDLSLDIPTVHHDEQDMAEASNAHNSDDTQDSPSDISNYNIINVDPENTKTHNIVLSSALTASPRAGYSDDVAIPGNQANAIPMQKHHYRKKKKGG